MKHEYMCGTLRLFFFLFVLYLSLLIWLQAFQILFVRRHPDEIPQTHDWFMNFYVYAKGMLLAEQSIVSKRGQGRAKLLLAAGGAK